MKGMASGLVRVCLKSVTSTILVQLMATVWMTSYMYLRMLNQFQYRDLSLFTSSLRKEKQWVSTLQAVSSLAREVGDKVEEPRPRRLTVVQEEEHKDQNSMQT